MRVVCGVRLTREQNIRFAERQRELLEREEGRLRRALKGFLRKGLK